MFLPSRFKKLEGRDGMIALRKAIFMRSPGGGKPPIFIVTCQRPGMGAYIYEHFIPTSMSWAHEGEQTTANIHGTIGEHGERVALSWRAGVTADPSGRFISFVEYLPEYGADLEKFQGPALPAGV